MAGGGSLQQVGGGPFCECISEGWQGGVDDQRSARTDFGRSLEFDRGLVSGRYESKCAAKLADFSIERGDALIEQVPEPAMTLCGFGSTAERCSEQPSSNVRRRFEICEIR
jgi:hypothetical protein